MKKGKNRRTLKNRIRRIIFVSFLLSVAFFSVVFLLFMRENYRLYSISSSEYISSYVSMDMNSYEFLKKMGISKLEDFNQNTTGYSDWKRNLDQNAGLLKEDFQKINEIVRLNNTVDYNKIKKFNGSFDGNGSKEGPPVSNFYITVTIDNKEVYSNRDVKDKISVGDKILKKLYNYYDVGSTKDLVNQYGTKIGTVKAVLNPMIMTMLFIITIVGIAVIVGVLLLIAFVMSKFFSIPIIEPLNKLQEKLDSIAQENYQITGDNQIVLKKPLREIENLAAATNTIMAKMKFNKELLEDNKAQLENQKQQLENQNEELEAQNEELEESKRKLEEIHERLKAREKSYRHLLDNAGEGFLSFGRELQINSEYSRECIKMLGINIESKKFSEVVFPEDKEQQKLMENVINKIFEVDEYKRSIYLPLLPEEVIIAGRNINIKYKPLTKGESSQVVNVMAILTDVTEKRALQQQMEKEKNILNMVVKVVVNYDEFLDIVSDFRRFNENKLNNIFDENINKEEVTAEIYRSVHTFKGNFAQMEMVNIVHKLHEMESQISILRNNNAPFEEIMEYVANCDMDEWLEEDIVTLTEVLGEEFFNNREDILIVDKSKVIDIEKKMISLLSSNECKLLLPDVSNLRYKPFNELFKSYSDYTIKLADRMNKMIRPVEIEGGEFLVDFEKYKEFSKTLIHVFRNIIDHGIESPEERIEKGKSEYGKINCKIETINNNIKLAISDDGYGVDIEKVKEKAIKQHLYTEEEISNMVDEQLLNIIFEDNISTKDSVSDLSGRGIGLSAVKHALDDIGGSIIVKSKKDIGTEFIILLPYKEMEYLTDMNAEDIMKPLVVTAQDFLSTHIGIKSAYLNEYKISVVEKVSLFKYTAFLNLKGILNAKLIVSADDSLTRIIARNYIIDGMTEEEEDEYMEDTIAECSNIFIGNSLKHFPGIEELVAIEAPVTINSDGASVNYPYSKMWSCSISCEAGNISFSIVTTELM